MKLAAVDIRGADAAMQTACEVSVQSFYDVYSAAEFVTKFGVDHTSLGLQFNGEVTNEEGQPEKVVLLKSERPRQLTLSSRVGTSLSEASDTRGVLYSIPHDLPECDNTRNSRCCS